MKTRSIEDFFREGEHFLHHTAAISFLLWPTKNSKKQAKTRATHLKTQLGIDEGNILNNRELRNHITHFDERLDTWAENSLGHNVVDQNIGDMQRAVSGVPTTAFLRNYNPQTLEYTFLNQPFNLQNILNAINDLSQSIQTYQLNQQREQP
ncbi:TPA: hypothetical protein JBI73_05975 [Legionella pneumophila]|nr:hypothetical protein [Legionella pneumophila]HAU1698878.1 hypothetical protein [Legionella pneumophila]